jgi:hypothetical protein
MALSCGLGSVEESRHSRRFIRQTITRKANDKQTAEDLASPAKSLHMTSKPTNDGLELTPWMADDGCTVAPTMMRRWYSDKLLPKNRHITSLSPIPRSPALGRLLARCQQRRSGSPRQSESGLTGARPRQQMRYHLPASSSLRIRADKDKPKKTEPL